MCSSDSAKQTNKQKREPRLRETERERGMALYEVKRLAERAATAEGWRQKERLRADA